MSKNQVATRKKGTAVGAPVHNPYADAVDDIGSTGSAYMSFSGKTGKFTQGMDKKEVPLESQLAVNMESFKTGWVCWKDEEFMDEVMGRVVDGFKKPSKSSLKDYGPYDEDGDGWKEQASVEFRDVDSGEQFEFKTSAISAVNGMRDMLATYGADFMEHPDEVMVIEIDAEEFEAKVKGKAKKQKNFKPTFDTVGWMDVEELEALAGGDGDDPADYDNETDESTDDLVDDDDDSVVDEPADEEEGEAAEEEPAPKKSSKKAGGSKSISGNGRKSKKF